MTSPNIYMFNGKKVRIEDSRRTGEDMNYVYTDEQGNRNSISCSISEFEEYFTPTSETFTPKRASDKKDKILYDVVYKIGNTVTEVLKPNLVKDKAFRFKQWATKQACPAGTLSNYRASGIKVQKARTSGLFLFQVL